MQGRLWTVIGECFIGAVFLAYGLTKKPLEFNELNPIKKPVSVLAARIVFLPLGALFLFFGLRDLMRVIR